MSVKFSFLQIFGMEILDQCTNINFSGSTKNTLQINAVTTCSVLDAFVHKVFSLRSLETEEAGFKCSKISPGQILHFHILVLNSLHTRV